ncbi:hypothetical protein U9M48_025395 [Paspalum notatum var. saurae]|uniref:Uncharacterized protein n=1 Tax=Paspalum notatum var. saurae TaxID=547442 RepID=A0AAQ3TUW0_PASNO
MGGCFSSGSAAAEDGGGERRVRRVWPTDQDGEWDVDNKAALFIANFHRHHSGVSCDCDCPDQTPPPPAA